MAFFVLFMSREIFEQANIYKSLTKQIEIIFAGLNDDERSLWQDVLDDMDDGGAASLKAFLDKYSLRDIDDKTKLLDEKNQFIGEVKRMSSEKLLTKAEETAIITYVENLSQGNFRLGKGSTAFVVPVDNDICCKVIYDLEKYSSHLEINKEMILTQEIRDLVDVAGVIVPEMVSSAVGNKINILSMETIKGLTLADCLERNILPPGFNPDDFFSRLTDFFQALHEKGYYHRDLHDGNVMIEWSSGLPAVIDFGQSAFFMNGDEHENPYIRKNQLTGESSRYLNDDNQLVALKNDLVKKIMSGDMEYAEKYRK